MYIRNESSNKVLSQLRSIFGFLTLKNGIKYVFRSMFDKNIFFKWVTFKCLFSFKRCKFINNQRIPQIHFEMKINVDLNERWMFLTLFVN